LFVQDLIEFTHQARPETVLETRSLGTLSMMDIAQEAGAWPDPEIDAFNVLLIRRYCAGAAEISYGGHRFRVAHSCVGDIALAPPGTYCNYDVASHHHLMAFPLPATLIRTVGTELNPHFSGDLLALHDGLFRSHTLAQRMLRLWRAAAGDAQAPGLDPEAAAIDLAETLVRLALEPSALKQQRLHLSAHARRQVLAYIAQHLDGDVSLTTLAQTANLSNYHFLRAFKAEMGFTPHQYIMDQRVQRAKVLLKQNGSDIAKIACNTGFASHQHFTTVFSKTVGRTPSAYRQRACHVNTH
jgi:AraC-like DNA-binding protein